jgi:hypothetical protein
VHVKGAQRRPPPSNSAAQLGVAGRAALKWLGTLHARVAAPFRVALNIEEPTLLSAWSVCRTPVRDRAGLRRSQSDL